MEKPTDPRNESFGALYRATLRPLQRTLARLLGNRTEAQDIAHDAYMRVYPRVKDGSARSPEAFLFTTARRLAINQLKRRSIAPVVPGGDAVDRAEAGAPGVARQVIARQEWGLVEEAVAKLPPGCRQVLLLRKIELLSHQEIADRLQLSVSTVEKQHARALRLLRAALPFDRPASNSGSDRKTQP
ncbi:MAG TPA: sigma-70 family RNA polymerase sigma factor [Candidatus Didemnitutus sp.]|jgi:RNA polymerase sigma-70 factor (ECF subfamily)